MHKQNSNDEIIARLVSQSNRLLAAYFEIMAERKRVDFCSLKVLTSKTDMSFKEASEAIGYLMGPYNDKWIVNRMQNDVCGPTIVVNGEVFNMFQLEKK